MFKEQLKKEIDNIKPSKQLKEKILADINKRQVTEKPQKRPVNKVRWVYSAVCVALALFVGLSGMAINRFGLFSKDGFSNNFDAVLEDSKEMVFDCDESTHDDGLGVSQSTTYKEIYTRFNEIYKSINRGNSTYKTYGDGLKGTASATMGTVEDSGSDMATQNDSFSQTNTQVSGVDEADIVKTDGKYIYVLNPYDGTVEIALANKGQPKKVSKVSWRREEWSSDGDTYSFKTARDMFVKNNRLVVISIDDVKTKSGKNNGSSRKIVTDIYNIESPENPTLIKSFSQTGQYISSRLIENNLFVFTTQSFYNKPSEEEKQTYLPYAGEGEDLTPIPEKDICAFNGDVDPSYFIALSVDINSAVIKDKKAVLGAGDTVYVNNNSIYAAANCYSAWYKNDNPSENTDITRLLKLKIENGVLLFAADGKVKGTILNQFSMDEYNGYFRIVTTVREYVPVSSETSKEKSAVSSSNSAVFSDDRVVANKQTNSLYVLNSRLETVGKLEDIAPDERVYSVRFNGDIGYFVTFRQVDPLFSVDLSNPANPKILSALKIPGFSEYLHPFGEGLLLGIGMEADFETGRTLGAKLSMFDVSDPKAVYEKTKHLAPCEQTYIGAENGHKTVMVDEAKNIIAFSGVDYDTVSTKSYYSYYVYGYSSGEFVQKAVLEGTGPDTRGLYIGDVFYVCSNEKITAYNINNYSKLGSVNF
ncbi:MAG: beta-propeller domain-containing protein [Clostridia bacterium]|nr:beta-propeller domain-containing protein [Clostridia bacterium]